ncbi:MAG: BON domain-containing protein, partial [Pirellulaceae bacterium]
MRRFFLGLALIAMLGVVPSKARGNDRQIARDIVTNLQQHKESGKLTDFNIELEVEAGAVYLKGHVANELQEQLAIDIARRVQGVKQVYNEMEIEQPAKDDGVQLASAQSPVRNAHADAASRDLAERIYARLRQEKDQGHLKGFSLDLEVLDGVATLTGKVASQDQLDLVLDVVRRVPGVKQVVNGLVVMAPQATGDISGNVIAEIQALKDSGELKDFGIDVQAEDGIVWLSGYVASETQRQLVLDTARFVPGVNKVVNDLAVEAPARGATR